MCDEWSTLKVKGSEKKLARLPKIAISRLIYLSEFTQSISNPDFVSKSNPFVSFPFNLVCTVFILTAGMWVKLS